VFREVRKRFERDLEPVGVMAHHTKVLMANGGYERLLKLLREKNVAGKK